MRDTHRWAREEFGDAGLGDSRRTQRLLKLASAFAECPAGAVTKVVNGAAREAAFRFVENEAIESTAIAAASHRAAARRMETTIEAIVPIDQTSLKLTDRVGKRGFGRVGTPTEGKSSRGFQVMTALGVGANGVTQGVLGQQWWARADFSPHSNRDRRSPEARESIMWRRAILQAHAVLKQESPDTNPWYQLDRGADGRALINLAVEHNLRITFRSAYSRTMTNGQYLHAFMRSQPVIGKYTLDVPARQERRARSTELLVRASPVELFISNKPSRRRSTVLLYCVHVRERVAPREGKRLEWFLLTTVPVSGLPDAMKVIRNYSLRWRVEEFHRAWKSSVCNIEQSQLRSDTAFKRWATIAAAVAARAERLKFQSRDAPDACATTELTRDEIDGAILLSETNKYSVGDNLTLEQAVRLIADVGGYVGKSSGGPPGTRVIQRGLERILPAAKVLAATRRCG